MKTRRKWKNIENNLILFLILFTKNTFAFEIDSLYVLFGFFPNFFFLFQKYNVIVQNKCAIIYIQIWMSGLRNKFNFGHDWDSNTHVNSNTRI